MRRIVALLAIVPVATIAKAQPHKHLELCDAAIVAETVSVESGLFPSWNISPENLPRTYSKFTLRVLHSIKGDIAPGTVEIAVPGPLIEETPFGQGYFSGKIGRKSLWYLQRNVEGKFGEDGRAMWQARGLQYAPIERSGVQFELVETEFRRSPDPIIELAELFAVNWAKRPRGYGMYVEQIRLIDPIGLAGYRGNRLRPDDPQRARLFEWLDRRLPEILGPNRSTEDLLNEYSVRLSWGQDEYSKRFTDLYLADPRSLKAALPAYLELVDLIRIFMASERALCAQLAASLPKTMPTEDRVRVTRKVLDFLAVDRTYDVPFLNALSSWWSRPDLSPLERGRVKADLAPIVEQARRLLDR